MHAAGGAAAYPIWGFLTALSRFTATLNGADVWDVVERGPNYLLPAALVYGIYKIRTTKPIDEAPEPDVFVPVDFAENGKSEAPPREVAGIH